MGKLQAIDLPSFKGRNLGFIGSIINIVYSWIFLSPFAGPSTSNKFLVTSTATLIMGILGVIGVIIGMKGKKNISGILLILAGIGGIISSIGQILVLLATGGFFPPITLIGSILILIVGVLVLRFEGEELLTESKKINKIRIKNYFSGRMEEIKEGSFIPTYEKIKELPEFSEIGQETFRSARSQWYRQYFGMPFFKYNAQLEKTRLNKQNQL